MLGLGVAISAFLYAIGFVVPEQPVTVWFCFVPLLVGLRGARLTRAWQAAGAFGALGGLASLTWTIELLADFAAMPVWAVVLSYVVVGLSHGLAPALVIGLVATARHRIGVAEVWSLPVSLAAVEFAYPMLFPMITGVTLSRFGAVTQVVELTGMAGLSVLVGLGNGVVLEVVEARRARQPLPRARVWLAAGVIVAALAYGAVRIPMVRAAGESAPRIQVALIQTNMGARDKAGLGERFRREHYELTKQAVAAHPDLDLIVWPESAHNAWLNHDAASVPEVTRDIGKPLVFGALTYEYDAAQKMKRYNSVLAATASGDVTGRFDKMMLVPFGEQIPLIETFPFLSRWLPRTEPYTPGTSFEHLAVADLKLLPTVCYEGTSARLVRRLWNEAGPAALLVNVTNDSWFGDTAEPRIHLATTTFRAIETRRPMLRATNTGISAIVDATGHITERGPLSTRAVVVGEVPIATDDSATIYMRFGDWLGWLAVALAALGLVTVLARARQPGPAQPQA